MVSCYVNKEFKSLKHLNLICSILLQINRNVASKKILIYLMMLPPEERNYGMEVICLSSARVQELIGLICWMYTCEGKQPKLQ